MEKYLDTMLVLVGYISFPILMALLLFLWNLLIGKSIKKNIKDCTGLLIFFYLLLGVSLIAYYLIHLITLKL